MKKVTLTIHVFASSIQYTQRRYLSYGSLFSSFSFSFFQEKKNHKIKKSERDKDLKNPSLSYLFYKKEKSTSLSQKINKNIKSVVCMVVVNCFLFTQRSEIPPLKIPNYGYWLMHIPKNKSKKKNSRICKMGQRLTAGSKQRGIMTLSIIQDSTSLS